MESPKSDHAVLKTLLRNARRDLDTMTRERMELEDRMWRSLDQLDRWPHRVAAWLLTVWDRYR